MNKSLTVLFAVATAAWFLPGPQGAALGADIVSVEPVADGALPPPLGAERLEELVSPVALYPDDLLAIVLPAATYPLDIVKAARFLERRNVDSSAEPDEAWDESVVALLNYPEVITLLNSDLDWTWALGEAVLYQEEDLIGAIERFRDRAYEAGNLRSDNHQEVSVDDGAITIEPVRSDVIYVPYYEPRQVVVYSRTPVYHYYPRPYPVYYYPYAADHYFSNGFFWGVSTAFHISFRSRNLRLHHYSYASHPYFGRRYFPSFYRFHRFHFSAPSYRHAYRASYRSSYHTATRNRAYGGDHWQGSYRTGVRPRVYNDHNYPQRHTSRSPVTAHGDVGSTRVSPNRNTNHNPSSTRTTTSVSNRLHTTGRPVDGNEVARNASRFRIGPDQVASTRRPAAASHDVRPSATTDHSPTRAVTSPEDDRRAPRTYDGGSRFTNAPAPARDAGASTTVNRSGRSAASSESRTNTARSQTRERGSEAGRSSSRERSASTNRSNHADRSPARPPSASTNRSNTRAERGRPVSKR